MDDWFLTKFWWLINRKRIYRDPFSFRLEPIWLLLPQSNQLLQPPKSSLKTMMASDHVFVEFLPLALGEAWGLSFLDLDCVAVNSKWPKRAHLLVKQCLKFKLRRNLLPNFTSDLTATLPKLGLVQISPWATPNEKIKKAPWDHQKSGFRLVPLIG